jgi:pimeloyl-ACP methyl ester carboxylesterase
MSAITIGGDLVHYEVLGRGRPVILIHGWIGAWQYWVPMMQQIHLKYRVYALDLFGFGDSAKNPKKYSYEQQVNLLSEFMNQMGLPKAAFIGHGLGAMILIKFASEHPERVARMLLVGAPLFNPGDLRTRNPAGTRVLLTPPPPQEEETVANRPVQTFNELPTIPRLGGVDRSQFLSRAAESTDNDALRSAIPVIPPSGGKNPLHTIFKNNSLDALLNKCFKRNDPSYDKLKAHVDKTDFQTLLSSSIQYDAGNMLDMLRLVKSPAVVVHGESDPVIPNPGEDVWDYLTIENEENLVPIPLEGVHHFPMLGHDPFARLVGDFLSQPQITNIEVKERWRRRSR